MLFILADWVMSESGYDADLPEGCEFLCLAGSARNSKCGLFCLSNPTDEESATLRGNRVPPELETLLNSALAYPPALAGASHALTTIAISDRETFVSELQRLLRARLDGQRSDRCVLLRSKRDEVGYREAGEYVWVVGYRPLDIGREVLWLSSDYQVYADPIESFDVSQEWLAQRFGNSDAEPGVGADSR